MRQKLSNFKAEFFKALAHPLRISILDELREGELTVNEISQKFSIEPRMLHNNSQFCAIRISWSRGKKVQMSIIR
jgi:ArsR family transcriptional regulator